MSAATEAAKNGLHPLVLDENAKPGGQLFKQIHKFFGSKEHKAKIRGFKIGEELLEEAEKYGVEVFTMTGFLDGINDSLKEPNPIETMDEDTVVSLAFDKELLYKNMVDAKADWLYELPQWENIFTEEKRKELYKEQKNSRTVHVEKKVYPNDPCPCGSGKKYKKCCGKNK